MGNTENVYYFLLLSVAIGFGVLYGLYLAGSVSSFKQTYDDFKNLKDMLSQAYISYYSGMYSMNSTFRLSLPCYSEYSVDRKVNIKCGNKYLKPFSIGFPLLLDIPHRNNQFYIERGEISYGPIKYYFGSITNKKILFFSIDVDNDNIKLIDNLMKLISESFPSSNIIGFCSDSYYLPICRTTNIQECNRNDFLIIYRSAGGIEKLFKDINNKGGELATDATCNVMKELNKRYFKLTPEFIQITDNPTKCEEMECIIVYGTNYDPPFQYIFKGKNELRLDINDIYDLILLLNFKHHYFIYADNSLLALPHSNYREMWIDYVTRVSEVMSKRYKLLENKRYNLYYKNYKQCESIFEEMSSKLCNDKEKVDSICEYGKADMEEYQKVKNMIKLLSDVSQLYYQEMKLGCEEEIYI